MKQLKVIVFPGVQNLPNLAAETLGFFQRRDLEIETIFTASSEQLRCGLSRGEYNIAHAAVDNAVAMHDGGKDDILIFAGLDQSFNKLVVRPEISRYEDLRGKTFGVDAPDTAFALIVYEMLRLKGLQKGEYRVQSIGATRFRLEALRDGKADFAMLNLPFNLFGQEAGLKILDNPIEVIGPYQSVGGFVRSAWAAENKDILVRYIAAYVEGLRWTLDPSNRKSASRLMQDRMQLTESIVERCLDEMLDPRTGFAVDAKLNEQGMVTLLDLRAKFTGAKAAPASRYIDESFYRGAIALLG